MTNNEPNLQPPPPHPLSLSTSSSSLHVLSPSVPLAAHLLSSPPDLSHSFAGTSREENCVFFLRSDAGAASPRATVASAGFRSRTVTRTHTLTCISAAVIQYKFILIAALLFLHTRPAARMGRDGSTCAGAPAQLI